MPAAVLTVLRTLIDAAFGAGSITDALHGELHARLNAVDPAIQNAPPPALSDAEQAELERLQAKQAQAQQAAAAPAGGTEGTGFGG